MLKISEPLLLIMEYVMCGKLLTYLRDRRSRVDRFQMPRGGLTSRDLTVFAYCVARGMDYLASKGVRLIVLWIFKKSRFQIIF